MSLLQPCSSLVPALFLTIVYFSFISHDAQSGLFCPHAKEDNLVVIAIEKLSTRFCKASGEDGGGGRENSCIFMKGTNYTHTRWWDMSTSFT